MSNCIWPLNPNEDYCHMNSMSCFWFGFVLMFTVTMVYFYLCWVFLSYNCYPMNSFFQDCKSVTWNPSISSYLHIFPSTWIPAQLGVARNQHNSHLLFPWWPSTSLSVKSCHISSMMTMLWLSWGISWWVTSWKRWQVMGVAYLLSMCRIYFMWLGDWWKLSQYKVWNYTGHHFCWVKEKLTWYALTIKNLKHVKPLVKLWC